MRLLAEIRWPQASWQIEYQDGKIIRPINPVTQAIEEFLGDKPSSLTILDALGRLGEVVILDADDEFMGGLLYDDVKEQ